LGFEKFPESMGHHNFFPFSRIQVVDRPQSAFYQNGVNTAMNPSPA
jgi:hypothetical protein